MTQPLADVGIGVFAENDQVYVEIITTHGKRKPKPVVEEVLLVDEEDGLPE